MENLRKTLAYKICGYIFYILILIALMCAVDSTQNALMWKQLVFVSLFFRNLLFIPIVILPVFFVLLILINEKSENKEFSAIADIAFFITIALFVMDVFALFSMLLVGLFYIIRG